MSVPGQIHRLILSSDSEVEKEEYRVSNRTQEQVAQVEEADM